MAISRTLGNWLWLLAGSILTIPRAPGAQEAVAPSDEAEKSIVPIELAPAETWNDLVLRRACAFWCEGDTASALAALQEREPSGAQSARADFLLAYGRHFVGEASSAAPGSDLGATGTSDYREWMAALTLLDRLESLDLRPAPGPFTSESELVTAASLLREGRAQDALRRLETAPDPGPNALLADALEARAREALGEDPTPLLRKLAAAEAANEVERELVSSARIRLATRAIEAGNDPRPYLDPISGDDPLSPRARHMTGVAEIERGRCEPGRTILQDLVHLHPDYERVRDVHRALGFLALREARWSDALRSLLLAEESWKEERRRLERLSDPASEDAVRRVWDRGMREARSRGTLVADPTALEHALREAARTALDLSTETPARFDDVDLFRVSREQGARQPRLPPPDPDGLREEARLSRELAEAKRRWSESRRREETRRANLARKARYVDRGLRLTGRAARSLRAARSRLDEFAGQGDEIVARYDSVGEKTVRHIAGRTSELLETVRRNRLLIESLRHFHGERSPRTPEIVPQGVPHPTTLLTSEGELVDSLETWVQALARVGPDLVRNSLEQVWIPDFTAGIRILSETAAQESARSERVRVSLESVRASSSEDSTLTANRAEIDRQQRRIQELEERRTALRHRLVQQSLAAAREEIREEGEGIAYGLGVASHELSSEVARELRANGSAPLESDPFAEPRERYEAFLADYPESPARGEIRFRLADVLMQSARDEFHAQMTELLGSEREPEALDRRSVAPLANYEPVLAQYRAILEDEPKFAHRDAALFQMAMTLLDTGAPDASRYFEELVSSHPDSRYAQEAHLRLGDALFLEDDFDGSLAHLEEAARGEAREQAAIALYKIGWAHYSRDHFDQAAETFARLLGRYREGEAAAWAADLREEAEVYLVHSLARGGGIETYDRVFEESAAHAAGARVLTKLGQLLRRDLRYREAAAADSLWIARQPLEPGALEAARRIAVELEQAGDAAGARRASLEYADHFRRGSPWFEANPSDSLRSSASEFVRSSYRRVAQHHHQEARDEGREDDWRASLDLYEEFLAEWPEAGAADTIRVYAAEAALSLGDFSGAVVHLESAAGGTLAESAAWQLIAVRDAWYESSRDTTEASKLGSVALAESLILAMDAVLAAHGDDPRTADLLWRRGTLAYGHGWLATSADAFETFARRYPAEDRAVTAHQGNARSLYESNRFESAALAYAAAARAAERAGSDSLSAEFTPLVSHCYFRHAEELARTDETKLAATHHFEEIAERDPAFEDADQSLYRAGLLYIERNEGDDAVRVWSRLLDRYPDSEYARDSHLEIADARARAGEPQDAAQALQRFAEAFPDDEDASAALLRGADLLEEAGDPAGADAMKTRHLALFPDDVDTTFEIREERAARELAQLGPERPISTLLGDGSRSEESELQRYLELAAQHAHKASPAILAQVPYLHGEEARESFLRLQLTQPLASSLAAKKELLERALVEYQRCVEHGVRPWNHAAAYRIGECLVAFGDALLVSDRPRGLSEEELIAYAEVLEEQSAPFFDRGEEAWIELLRSSRSDPEDRWTARARESLWPRLASRFVHVPVLDYPLVASRKSEPGGP